MKNIIDKCVILTALSLTSFLFAVISYEPEPIVYDGFSSRDMYCELPRDLYRDEADSLEPYAYKYFRELYRNIHSIQVTVVYPRLVLLDSHRVFLTAYCAEECDWSYATSSGETCHRSSDDNSYEPTTCAIDLRYFSYGTMFYVPSEDRIYIAEDTGPGVRGLWIDTYQEDMHDVYSYDTRYETVYTCEFEDYEVTYSSNNSIELIHHYLSGMKDVC